MGFEVGEYSFLLTVARCLLPVVSFPVVAWFPVADP